MGSETKIGKILHIIGCIVGCIFINIAQSDASSYRIKQSEVSLPKGASYGLYRRTITPFEFWTLICDEDAMKKQRICNVTQNIEDADDAFVFSWSLVGTEGGKPVFIFRAPAALGANRVIQLRLTGEKKPVDINTTACDENICLAMQPVGPILRKHLEKGSDVVISFKEAGKKNTTINTTLRGVTDAMSNIPR